MQNELATQYLAQRTPGGWVTHPFVARVSSVGTEPNFVRVFAPELDRWLFAETAGLDSGQSGGPQKSAYYSMGLDDGEIIPNATLPLGPVEGKTRSNSEYMNVAGASSDLSHLVITTYSRLLPSPGDPRLDAYGASSNESSGDRIYEVFGAGGPKSALRLVAEVPLGLPSGDGCGIDDQSTIGRQLNSTPRVINEGGSTIFYTAPIEITAGSGCGVGAPNPIGLFARTGEAPAVELNSPPTTQCTSPHPCASAGAAIPLYDGAAADGSRVWFTTTQPLINSDTDATNDLYVANLEPDGQLKELVQASAGEATATHPTPGSGADVGETGVQGEGGSIPQGVVRISPDGSHAAFESPAVLTEEPNSLHQTAMNGANNLYVYDAATGMTKFVAELCSGPEAFRSNQGPKPQGSHHVTSALAVSDPACPASVSPEISTFIPPQGNDDVLWLPGNGG